MPLLEITSETIGPKRTRQSLAYLEAIMLWPNDAARRATAMQAAAATLLEGTIEPIAAAITANNQVLRKTAERPFVHGVLVGTLLAAAVADYAKAGAVKLQSLKAEITANKDEMLSMGGSTLESVWAEYKSVSHLWASYVYRAGPRGQDNPIFPCRLDQLTEFLGLAEFYARHGLRVQLLRRAETMLMSNQLWMLPEGLNLPAYRPLF